MTTDTKWTPEEDRIEDEEEEEDVARYQDQKDAILFAIHVSESMLAVHGDDPDSMDVVDPKRRKKKDENQSAVRMALECASSILQSRIISNPNDMMAILLYGTKKTKAASGPGSTGGFTHCYYLMELDVPDADGIKELKALLEDEDHYNEILAPSSTSVSMANVLFCANQIFTIKCPNFASRKLFIVTDDDDPHSTDKALKNSAITRARDLYDLGVIIDPFYISYPGKPAFDPSKFYDDIVYRSPYSDDDIVENTIGMSGAQRLKAMRTTLLSKSTPKRALFSTKMEIAPGLVIGVKGYLMFKKQEKARSHYVYTGGEKVQIVEGHTTQLAEFTAQVVDKSEIKRAYKFGGEHIVFDDDEMKEMRRFGDPVIRILGFKPASALQFDHNVKPASFIYPDEQEFVGSTRTFTALHNKLYQDDKIAIAWAVTRKGAAPTLVALMPSLYDAADPFPLPSGFFMIQLPFADDIRKNPDIPCSPAAKDLVDAMRDVVKPLYIATGYLPEKYENPSLQWHYRILQAMALEEDQPEDPVDKTLPKYKLIDKHTGDKVLKWAEVFEKYARVLRVRAEKEVGGKRMAEVEGGRAPRAKKGPAGDGAVIDAYKAGNLAKLTVASLKDYLISHNLPATGRKPQLIEAIEEYLDKKGI